VLRLNSPASVIIRFSRCHAIGLTLLFFWLVAPSAQSQNYSLDWFTVAGGGGTSAGGNYSLSGTIGQAAAGSTMASSSFTVCGGFWSLFDPLGDLPLLLPAQKNWVIDVLTTLHVTNAATTARDPSTTLNYRFLKAPSGASIDTNGLIAWTPSQAQGPSTNTVTTVVTDSGTSSSATNSFDVFVRGLYLGIDLTDPTAATADPTGDGFPNLLKYAVGIDPATPGDDMNGLTISLSNSGGGQYLSLTFRQRRNVPWLSYTPEVSGDRQTWFSDTAHIQEINTVPLDDQFDSKTVQDLTPTTSSSPRFIRLRVTSN